MAARRYAAPHSDTSRLPGFIPRSSGATRAGQVRRQREVDDPNGGMTTVSAVRTTSGPWSTATEKSAFVRTGPPSSEQVTTR